MDMFWIILIVIVLIPLFIWLSASRSKSQAVVAQHKALRHIEDRFVDLKNASIEAAEVARQLAQRIENVDEANLSPDEILILRDAMFKLHNTATALGSALTDFERATAQL